VAPSCIIFLWHGNIPKKSMTTKCFDNRNMAETMIKA